MFEGNNTNYTELDENLTVVLTCEACGRIALGTEDEDYEEFVCVDCGNNKWQSLPFQRIDEAPNIQYDDDDEDEELIVDDEFPDIEESNDDDDNVDDDEDSNKEARFKHSSHAPVSARNRHVRTSAPRMQAGRQRDPSLIKLAYIIESDYDDSLENIDPKKYSMTVGDLISELKGEKGDPTVILRDPYGGESYLDSAGAFVEDSVLIIPYGNSIENWHEKVEGSLTVIKNLEKFDKNMRVFMGEDIYNVWPITYSYRGFHNDYGAFDEDSYSGWPDYDGDRKYHSQIRRRYSSMNNKPRNKSRFERHSSRCHPSSRLRRYSQMMAKRMRYRKGR
jgi:hypothetical protein